MCSSCLVYLSYLHEFFMFNIKYLLRTNLLVIKPVLRRSKSLKYSVSLTFLALTIFLILSSISFSATGLLKL